VLLADADDTARAALADVLRQEGFVILEAADGAEAIEHFRVSRPDLVILDTVIPETGGFEACTFIRETAGTDPVSILLLTDLEEPDALERAFDTGATDFTTKSVSTAQIMLRVRFLLRARRKTRELLHSEARLEAAQRIAHLGTWEIEEGAADLALSREAARLLGLDEDPARLPLEEFLARLDGAGETELGRAIARARRMGGGFSVDCTLRLSDESQRALHVQAETISGPEGAPVLAGTIQDVTKREEAQDQIRQLAYYDDLTGLPNRAFFNKTLHAALARARRRKDRLAVFFVDLDHFKRINDTMGHSAGDGLLQAVARRLLETVRKEDIVSRLGADDASGVARLGGDEFILLASDLKIAEEAAYVAQRILEAFRAPVPLGTGEVVVSASVGISLFPQDGENAEELLKNADAALYHAKDSGRNNYQFYNPRMNAAAFERLTLARSIRHALERNEFVLHYQPQVTPRDGRIAGVEALLRWQHPDLGLFRPAQFIAVAEECGLIQRIGEHVLDRACAQLDDWLAEGLPPVRMAVNISGRQFHDPDFLVSVHKALWHARAPAEQIELEITESVLMDNAPATIEILRDLDAKGVRIAVDDFGSGYSSLSYLKRFPLDSLKIDRSFIRDVATDPQDAAIVSAVLGLARSLDLTAIAEGVETTDQRESLHELGCDLMQGYLFGKPMPAGEMKALLLEQMPAREAKRRQRG
jgi:diguanylate cyclase (GGDEF)-like protein